MAVRLPDAPAESAALVKVTIPVLLVRVPVVVAVTLTRMAQPPGGMVPPIKVREVVPLAAVTKPPHVLEATTAPEVTFARPAGYVSVKAAPVTATALALLNVMVICAAPPTVMVDGLNDLVMPGVGRLTSSTAVLLTGPAEPD